MKNRNFFGILETFQIPMYIYYAGCLKSNTTDTFFIYIYDYSEVLNIRSFYWLKK